MSEGGAIVLGGALGPGGLGLMSGGFVLDGGGIPATGITAFDARVGLDQGRLPRRPAGGDFAFVLGSTLSERVEDLAPGDFVQVDRVADVTGATFVRFGLDLFVPRSTPAGYEWRVGLLLDGVEVVSAAGWKGLRRAPADLAINVSKLSGEHTIGVRVRLAEV